MPVPFNAGPPESASPAVVPAELLGAFNTVFLRSHRLIEEYICRLALQVFVQLDRARAGRDEASVDEILAAAGLVADTARVPLQWMLSTFEHRGWAHRLGDAAGAARYRLNVPAETPDPDEIQALQRATDPASLPAFSIAALAARHYPAVLRGERAGEDVLFAAENLNAWVEYFSNSNPLYAINNTVGAIAALRSMPAGGGEILELGGGLGSAAEALLARARDEGRHSDVASYALTEIAPAFLRRARNLLNERFAGWPLSFHWMDVDKPFPQNIAAPGRFALVYGVNVLHVAHDLSLTLERIRQVLRPDGALVICECMRPFDGRPLYVEFVFNLLKSFQTPRLVAPWRPNGGFLTPEQWTAALSASGFADVRVYPDLFAIRRVHPSFFVGCVTAKAW